MTSWRCMLEWFSFIITTLSLVEYDQETSEMCVIRLAMCLKNTSRLHQTYASKNRTMGTIARKTSKADCRTTWKILQPIICINSLHLLSCKKICWSQLWTVADSKLWGTLFQVARPGTSLKKPGTAGQGTSTSQGIRPMSQSGRPVSGFVRPGTQSGRPGTMEQAIKTPRTAHTARPVTR